MRFPGKEIETKNIDKMYLLYLRDECDFHKVSAYDAHSGNKGIGATVWRFSNIFKKTKILLYKIKFDWIFRKKWRLNPFYDDYFDPNMIDDHHKFLMNLCKKY